MTTISSITEETIGKIHGYVFGYVFGNKYHRGRHNGHNSKCPNLFPFKRIQNARYLKIFLLRGRWMNNQRKTNPV